MESILKTVAYFDLFDYPLTTFEIWKWLWGEDGQKVSYAEVERIVTEDELIKKHIIQCGAFWCLKGREEIIDTRNERHRLSIAKTKRACRIVRLFSYIPWIEGIAICNLLGYRNATVPSDIDLFVIARSGTIWLVRFLTVGLMAMAGLRPTASKTANTVCLSFFISSDAMSLKHLQKPNSDPHFIYWITQFTPLFGRDDIWIRFWEQNSWIQSRLPNIVPNYGQGWFYREKKKSGAIGASQLITILNRVSRGWQTKHLPRRLRELSEQNTTDVVINDRVLKFHENDRREEYRKRWEQRCAQLIGQSIGYNFDHY